MGYLEKLYQQQRRLAAPDGPQDERAEVSQQIFGSILGNLSRADVAAASDFREQVRSHPVLAKAKVLEPQRYQMLYPAAYQDRRPKHRTILYCSELGMLGTSTGEGWAEKGYGFSGFAALKLMARQLDIVQAIITTRKSQCTNYWRRYRTEDANPLGYSWLREDGERLGKDDLKEVAYFDDVLQNSGTELDPIKRQFTEGRRSFRGFMDTALVDSLTADWCPIETVRSYGGELIGWHNIPFDTIRLAFEEGYDGDDQIVAVQIDPNARQATIALEADEIICEVRNPRSDLGLGGYGMAELESLVRTMTVYLNTMATTAAALDRNTIPRGALILHGDYDKRALLDLQSTWNALLSGALNRFKFPILTSKSKSEGGATWIKFDDGKTDMLNTKTLTFICALACAEFGMAPEEINLESFSAGKSSLSGEDTSEKLQSSHDRGLIPLLTWMFDGLVNPRLVKQLTPKYRIVPVGLFPQDEARKHERQKLTLTVNEMRQIDGEDAHPSKIMGEAPVNAALNALYVQELQQQGVLPPPQAPGEEGQGEQPPGKPGTFTHDEIGLTGSEAPLPPDPAKATKPAGAGGQRPKPQPFVGGKAQMAKGRLRVTIRDLDAEDATP